MGCSEPQNSQRCIIVPPGTEYAVLQEIIALVLSRIHYITPLIVYQIYFNFSIIVFSIQQSCCETATLALQVFSPLIRLMPVTVGEDSRRTDRLCWQSKCLLESWRSHRLCHYLR